MKLVIFGLSISSSWGNGHATLWRGLCRALVRRGHSIHFFERDAPYYAEHRDLTRLPGCHIHIYQDWRDVAALAARHVREADVNLITSYCPDALEAARLVHDANGLSVFYDLDTGVTLQRLAGDAPVDYIGPNGLRDYSLVLSYVGGRALDELESRLGARATAPLYGSVDPDTHVPVEPLHRFRSDLSYLGTYARDRQQALEGLMLEPARRCPDYTFRIAGALYPYSFPWAENVRFEAHLPPNEHSAFYCSSRLTLNVTREAMAAYGYCPSGRFFEAAACGTPIVTDEWEGVESFFEPDVEILRARNAEDVIAALQRSDADLQRIGRAARERTLDQHTASIRAAELEQVLSETYAARALPAAVEV